MGRTLERLAHLVIRYLEKPADNYESVTRGDPDALRALLQPGDVLLVEGNNRMSDVIKYLTQSTWSHAALYVGVIDGKLTKDGEPHVLVEANVAEGVVSAPLSKYAKLHTRVCRPVALMSDDCDKVCKYAVERIGLGYDLRNIFDFLRYLIPTPFSRRFRSRAIALRSGDSTRLICSTLVAQAFAVIRYPILPSGTGVASCAAGREVLEIRHSFCAPRDFDISPYFESLKPTTITRANHRETYWRKHQQLDQCNRSPVAASFGPPFTTSDQDLTAPSRSWNAVRRRA